MLQKKKQKKKHNSIFIPSPHFCRIYNFYIVEVFLTFTFSYYHNLHICFNLSSRDNGFNFPSLFSHCNFFIHQRNAEVKKELEKLYSLNFYIFKMVAIRLNCSFSRYKDSWISLFFKDLIGMDCSIVSFEYWYKEVWDYPAFFPSLSLLILLSVCGIY